MSEKYTEILKEKLIKTGVFKINDINVEEKAADLKIEEIKKAVNKECAKKGIRSAIYGYVVKKNLGYELKVLLYSASDDEIISEYTDRLYNESGIEMSTKKCAVEFASRIMSIKSSKMFFASLFMPGLGQIINKSYLKGALLMGGFAYCFIMNSAVKIPDFREREFTDFWVLGIHKYNIVRNEIPSKEWIRIKTEYDERKERTEELRKLKSGCQIGMAVIYLVNVLDVLISSKKYNDKRAIENRLSFEINSSGVMPELCLKYRF